MPELMARLSARRPFIVIAIWAVIVVIAGGLAADAEMVPGAQAHTDFMERGTTTEFRLNSGADAERANRLLEDRLRAPTPVQEILIIQSDSLTVDDPAFQAKIQSVYEDILALGDDVVRPGPLQNYYLTNDPSLVSTKDRSATIVPLVMTGALEDAIDNIPDVLHVVEEADGEDGFRVLVVGDASTSFENIELGERDVRQGEQIGLPAALIILLVLFGTVIAALIPMGLSILAIVVALGIPAIIGQAFDLIIFVTLMISMIGLAVGIDYSLIIFSRYRDELARGLDTFAALERAGHTAGRTVLFSGLTVVIALCGIFIVPFSLFQSLALGAVVVVLVALAATFTLLPAILAAIGPRINVLRIPFTSKPGATPADSSGHGFWDVITRVVTRFPIISSIVVAVPILVVTVFYFQIHTGINGVDDFPEGAQTRDAFFVMEEHFSFGLFNPTDIVIDGDIESPAVQQAIGSLQTSLPNNPGLQLLPGPVVNDAGDLAVLTAIIPGEPRSQAAIDVFEAVRNDDVPAAFQGVDAEVLIGGTTATAAHVFSIVRTYSRSCSSSCWGSALSCSCSCSGPSSSPSKRSS